MASVRISKMRTHESRSERALRSHVHRIRLLRESRSKTPLYFAFQNAFQKPNLKELCVHKGSIQAFESEKFPNHVPKRLSERDSLLCEKAHCVGVIHLLNILYVTCNMFYVYLKSLKGEMHSAHFYLNMLIPDIFEQ